MAIDADEGTGAAWVDANSGYVAEIVGLSPSGRFDMGDAGWNDSNCDCVYH